MLLSLGLAAFAALAVVVTSASVVILQRDENSRIKLELAKAQQETELLRGKFAWRRIDPNKYSQLVSDLKPMATLIGVSSFADPESSSYADDIAEALNDAGFTVRRQYGTSIPRYDLTLLWPSDRMTALRIALRKADVPIELGQANCGRPSMPDGKSMWDETLPLICVGLKPRPSP